MQGRCEWLAEVEVVTKECTAYLVFFQTVLEDVLNDQTARLAQSDLMPHASERFVDITHNLRRRVTPSQLE